MCGIAGIYNLDGSILPVEKLERFTDSMGHRGPDGAGYRLFSDKTLGFGHRRLSILDLSEAGKQPMSYAEGRYWITYNGEVFNFNEIRQELSLKGYRFVSDSDTEIILAAYVQYGKECLNKFNGMWALAIWDSETHELFLARDRFGIKPLYYLYLQGKVFAFASETRAFKHLDGFERIFDESLLQINLKDHYALEGSGYTPFKDIVQLLPGHYLIVKKGKPLQQKRWWHISRQLLENVPVSLKEQAQEFYALFRDACRIRLISDVPVATALSGGLDSTSVYSTVFDIQKQESLSRVNKDSQRAFTAVFPGLPNDEQAYAQQAVAFTGGTIDLITTDEANLIDQIERETELCDLLCDFPITSLSAVYAGMRKNGIVVSMDGHGVDEMLYGYRDMIYSLYNSSLWEGPVTKARTYSEILSNMYHIDSKPEARKRFDKELNQKAEREGNLMFRVKSKFKRSISSTEFVPVDLPALSDDPYDFSKFPLEERMVYYEFFQHTLPALLRNFDRAGMMNSVEIRMPFMDWRLVRYVFSLTASNKVGEGYTKLILREAMKGRMDESLRTRTFKVGIGSPVDHWFNTSLKDWVLDNIDEGPLKKEAELEYKQGKLKPALARAIWQKINTQLIKN